MKQKNLKRITLRDVAKDADVSVATASLVVRGSTLVAETTNRKVLESMDRLGYVYNRVAANLRSKKSSTIGVIVNDIGNPFFSKLMVGIHNELDKYDYTILLGSTFYSKTKQEHLLETMLQHRVCGLIISPATDTSREDIEKMRNIGVPMILIGREVDAVSIDYVGADFKLGNQMATQHLIENGHCRIALLGGMPDNSAYQARLEGYKAALKAHSITPDDSLIITSPPTQDGGYKAIHEVMKHHNPPTAVLCHNDIVAIGVILWLQSAGLMPGRDIAVVGFDNIQESAINLTTVSVAPYQWGVEAAKLLHRRILGSGGSPVRVILPCDLIIRGSSERNHSIFS